MYDLIYTKKLGGELTNDQLHYWINGVINQTIPYEQSSAMLMAICWRGMTIQETSSLTLLMRNSGKIIDLSSVQPFKVEKHSTGGVGDSVSLVIGPILSACGVHCPMLSGAGLGHTGGTVDKYHSFPGLKVSLSPEEFLASLRETCFANSAQTPEICPADRILYALRDSTATVESIPLITASIMSKKLAGGANGLLLDVKCGSGAFMKTFEEAKSLAESLVRVGKTNGLKVKALITRMNEPLGYSIGNALEVIESIEILRGSHRKSTTASTSSATSTTETMNLQTTILAELSYRIAAEMLLLANHCSNLLEAEKCVKEVIDNGLALKKYQEWIQFNGGHKEVFDNYLLFPQAGRVYTICSQGNGFIKEIESRKLGILAMQLGAGRKNKDDILDLGVGLKLHKRVGEEVKIGEILITVLAKKEQLVDLYPEDGWITLVDSREELPKILSGPEYWLLGQVE